MISYLPCSTYRCHPLYMLAIFLIKIWKYHMNYLDDFIYIFFNFSLINSIFDSNKETIVGSFFEDDLVYLLFSTFFTFLFSPTWTSLKFRMLWPVSPVVKIRKKDNKVISLINSILANFSSSPSQTYHVKIWFSFSPLPHLLHLPLLTNMSLLEIQNALASLTGCQDKEKRIIR